MKTFAKFLLLGLACLLLLILVGPFLIPIPALQDVQPPAQLAGPDSRFIQIGDLNVHYQTAGQGEPAMLLLHGFASSLFTWREVLGPLSVAGQVIAYDRPASGLTSRPLGWEGQSPYSPAAQVQLIIDLLDAFDLDQAVLIGNSAGGSLAVAAALEHPERVKALVLVDAAVFTRTGAPGFFQPLLRTPQAARLGPLFIRRLFSTSHQSFGRRFAESAWHDPTRVTPAIWEGYTQPLRAENWDRAMWALATAGSYPDLTARLDQLDLPVLVITGDDDRIVPTAESLRLAAEIPNARQVVLPACGHIPQEECPQLFLENILTFLEEINHAQN